MMKTKLFLFFKFFMNFIRILKILCSINTTKRVLRRFKKGLKNKFVLLKDDILKDDKGIKEYPK
ncbi:hypothetical protein predicted by Glimmer/Critica [Helicobacter pylori B8]|uniref:Uncharacterized protein n=2 Tax=Helicobacter pylori TaxID=210 RepID=D7FDA1_HELP3|nr:hypothetical protein predicted by Glimmer/Critica [Helicobacter pylori B8]